MEHGKKSKFSKNVELVDPNNSTVLTQATSDACTTRNVILP